MVMDCPYRCLWRNVNCTRTWDDSTEDVSCLSDYNSSCYPNLKSGQNKRVQGDAIVGMVSTGTALGYLAMNSISTNRRYRGDVARSWFYINPYTSKAEVWLRYRIYHRSNLYL